MSERYGGRAPGYRGAQLNRRTLLIIAGIIAVLITAGAAFFAFRPAGAPTTASDVAFEAVDSNRAIVEFNIRPDRSRDSVCSVVAKNDFEAVVGYREVTIPAAPDTASSDLFHQEVSVNTTQLAVQGHLETCWFVS
ncbi:MULTISPECIES: DUF4307 domain-containing protein [unclassified Brevibacterium]|uniref:DUF4307 domain-containing protein n=1 Tax=unclassified Brevibacterium TaxID=2614124 RepID=UPI0008A5F8AC|nr:MULTISPECIES: DUF4307 domain-containing protein [unclassified Brevibacterium]OFL67173.1 hypothetical protein HMPREF2757_10750 [Brevibacterium sp. HMSC063G07]OFS26302.1 hypothetical protein HMPREF3162_06785 [Brevibacterium sp. HMSC07C04]